MEDLVLSCLESRVEENRNLYARFLVGPFFKGDALTVATALRRVLLSSVESVAITALYIQGITHEFSSIVGVRESVLELSLNFQSVVLCYDKRFFQKNTFFDDTQIGYLQVQGPKVVYANDLKLPLGVKVVDPTQYIATISREGVLVLKFTLGKISNSPGQPTSLPPTKQAITQQLLKRNIVKAKTRCSYKKNYAVNPNIYCYSSIKRFVRAASSTAQLIGEPYLTSYQPLVFANSLTSKPFVYNYKQNYKHKEHNNGVSGSENGASRTVAVKAVNKAEAFFKVNSYVQRKNLKLPFCRFKENGSYTKSFFFYNANNAKCKLLKPKKKEKSYTNHKCFGYTGGNQLPSIYKSSYKCKAMPMLPLGAIGGTGKGRTNLLTNLRFVCKRKEICKKMMAYKSKQAGLDFVPKAPRICVPSIKQNIALHTNAKIISLANRRFDRDALTYKSKICKPKAIKSSICKGHSHATFGGQRVAKRRQCTCKQSKSDDPINLRFVSPKVYNGDAKLRFARRFVSKGPCKAKLCIGQQSDDFKSNYSFNETLKGFKLIENVFQSDICLHNIIPLDSSLSPVLKVNFLIEIDDEVLYLRQKVRERIILEVWTNGSIHPRQALHDATLSLLDIFSTFRSIYQTNEYSSTLLKVPEYNKKLKNN